MLTFDEATHVYRYNGAVVPSVTQIIDRIFPWNPPPGIDVDYVRSRGRAIHHACRLYDEGRLDESSVDSSITPRLDAWKRFRHQMQRPVIDCETARYSPLYRFAGTRDRMFSGGLLCDIKSSRTKTAPLQLGGYAILDTDATEGVVVVLNDNGTYCADWYTTKELRRLSAMFTACVTLYGYAAEQGL